MNCHVGFPYITVDPTGTFRHNYGIEHRLFFFFLKKVRMNAKCILDIELMVWRKEGKRLKEFVFWNFKHIHRALIFLLQKDQLCDCIWYGCT